MCLGEEARIEQEINAQLLYNRAVKLAANNIWIMRDGTMINIADMSDEHIINCLKMLERKNNFNDITDLYIDMFIRELIIRGIIW